MGRGASCFWVPTFWDQIPSARTRQQISNGCFILTDVNNWRLQESYIPQQSIFSLIPHIPNYLTLKLLIWLAVCFSDRLWTSFDSSKRALIERVLTKGTGCGGSVGKVVASYTRGQQFESRHHRRFYWTLLTVICIEKTKIKKKRPGMAALDKIRTGQLKWLEGLHDNVAKTLAV